MSGRRTRAARTASAAFVALSTVCCGHSRPVMAEGPQTQSPRSVSVYALSKGKGVPPETRDTFDKARALLQQLQRENRVSRVHESRIGIEGETRVCAEFADERVANETIQKLRDLFRGVPLSNVKEEPCRKAE